MQWSPVQAKGTMLNANIGTSKMVLENFIFYFHLFSGFPCCFFPSQVVHVEPFRDVRHSGPAKSAPARRLETAGFNMFQHPPGSMVVRIGTRCDPGKKDLGFISLLFWLCGHFPWVKTVQIPLFCCLPCRDVFVVLGHCFVGQSTGNWTYLSISVGWSLIFFSYSLYDWSKPTFFAR
jgi:hypothetical protein